MMPVGVDVFVSVAPIDLRWGFARLTGVVRECCGRDIRGRAVFVFFARHRQAVKVIYFDGTGLCLWYKRLDRGQFRAAVTAAPDAMAVRIDDVTLTALLADLELDRPPRKNAVH